MKNVKDKIIELRRQGILISEICNILKVGKGTVGYHLKNTGIKVKVKLSIETKTKIGNSHRGLIKKKREKNDPILKRNQEGYINPKMMNYWPILMGEVKSKGTYHNSLRGQIKRFILKMKLIPYICNECECDENWRNKKMPLILDHINGINNDHRLENLRFLCSNCDSIQDTYKSKNKMNKL